VFRDICISIVGEDDAGAPDNATAAPDDANISK
jgi:hypothetical protein